MHRLVVSLVASSLFSFSMLACAVDTTTEPTEPSAAHEGATDSNAPREATPDMMSSSSGGGSDPYCLPGEKKVCTLGPPPVCKCEIVKLSPVLGRFD